MIEPAVASCRPLDAGNACPAQCLEMGKSEEIVAPGRLEARRERRGILDGQGRPLGEIRQHGMRRIAEKGDTPLGPALERREPIERPAAPGVDGIDQGARPALPNP